MQFTLHRLTRHPLAVCNDGTVAGYYFVPPSQNSSSSTWLFYLASGGWCYDASSCESRCIEKPKYCGSNEWWDHQPYHGILESPLFDTGGRVYLRYCTSDAHMGNATAFGRQFRGAEVVRATLYELVHTHGLGSVSETTLVFGGGSAGARGAMVHLDWIAEDYLPRLLSHSRRQLVWGFGGDGDSFPADSSATTRVRTVGFIDSAMWVDLLPMKGAAFPGFANVTRLVHSYAKVPIDQACASYYPGATSWKCLFGQYRLPLVRTPYVAIGSQHDSYQLGKNLLSSSSSPSTQAGQQYLIGFASATLKLADALGDGGEGDASRGEGGDGGWFGVRGTFGRRTSEDGESSSDPPHAPRVVLSTRCHRHSVSANTGAFDRRGCLPMSMEQALKQLLDETEGPSGRSHEYADRGQCPADSYHPCVCCEADDPWWYELASPRHLAAGLAFVVLAGACCWRYYRTRRSARRRRATAAKLWSPGGTTISMELQGSPSPGGLR